MYALLGRPEVRSGATASAGDFNASYLFVFNIRRRGKIALLSSSLLRAHELLRVYTLRLTHTLMHELTRTHASIERRERPPPPPWNRVKVFKLTPLAPPPKRRQAAPPKP